MPEPEALHLALLQLRTPQDPQNAIRHLEPLVAEAAAEGARLITTPEYSNFMERHPLRQRELACEMLEDPLVHWARRRCADLQVWMLLGSVVVKGPGDRLLNRSILIDDRGGVVATYDKMHMFDVDLPGGRRVRESDAFAPGAGLAFADTPFGRVGLSVCYDLRFPYLYRTLAQGGADFITVPSAFTQITGEAHWEVLLRARAIETGAFVVAPAQGGRHEDGRTTWGRSMIVSPTGEVLAAAADDEPRVVSVRVDFGAVKVARAAIPAWARTIHEAGTARS